MAITLDQLNAASHAEAAQMLDGLLQVAGGHGIRAEISQHDDEIGRIERGVRFARAPRSIARRLDVARRIFELAQVQQGARVGFTAGSFGSRHLEKTATRRLYVAALQIGNRPQA